VSFRLYPVAQHWWSFSDYGAVIDVMQRTQARRILEFGPGSSTLALIEGGATSVDACEDDPRWVDLYRERLERRFAGAVAIVPYCWADPLTIPSIDQRHYDLALIDGPRETPKRLAVIEYCLARCREVLVPTEQHDGMMMIREAVERLAAASGRPLCITETGPLAGAFALLGPPC